MTKTRTRRRRKARVITYRTEPEDERYFHDHAERLIGSMVVLYDPKNERFERAVLQGVGKPGTDSFRVSWEGRHRRLKGLWRVHHPGLFGGGKYPKKRKPIPRIAQVSGVDSSLQSNNGSSRRTTSMATAVKKGGAKKAAASKGRGRPSALDSLTEKQRTALASRVRKLREQGVPWDGDEGICSQVDGVSSAVIGRKLLKEVGADDLIRERVLSNGGGSSKKTAAAKKAPAKKTGTAKAKGKKVVIRRGKGSSKNPS